MLIRVSRGRPTKSPPPQLEALTSRQAELRLSHLLKQEMQLSDRKSSGDDVIRRLIALDESAPQSVLSVSKSTHRQM